MDAFKAEAEGHLALLIQALPSLEKTPDDQELLQELFRAAHTFRGASLMMEFHSMHDVAHAVEDLLLSLKEKQIPFHPSMMGLFTEAVKALQTALLQVVRGEPENIPTQSICKKIADACRKPLHSQEPPKPLGVIALPEKSPETARKFSFFPKKMKILLVEDSLTMRELEKTILLNRGYTVETAIDGYDALEKLSHVRYDLIVSDIQMPRMDGLEFCKALRANPHWKTIPVVLVTTLYNEEESRKSIAAGAQACLTKMQIEEGLFLDVVKRLVPEV